MRVKRKFAEISIAVMWQDCGDSLRNGPIHDYDLEAIAETFLRAAEAVRNREHESVECEANGTYIGVDYGGHITRKLAFQLSLASGSRKA